MYGVGSLFGGWGAMNEQELRTAAQEAATRAYAPYSRFYVGAAVLLATGEVVTGCNVENASYRLTCCAEQTAIARAVAEFGPGVRIAAVAVANRDTSIACAPCGGVPANHCGIRGERLSCVLSGWSGGMPRWRTCSQHDSTRRCCRHERADRACGGRHSEEARWTRANGGGNCRVCAWRGAAGNYPGTHGCAADGDFSAGHDIAGVGGAYGRDAHVWGGFRRCGPARGDGR